MLVRTFLAALMAFGVASISSADILYESGTLGPTGIPYPDDFDLRTDLNIGFIGVRFQLTQSVLTSQIGGHFISESNGTFFGAIVALDDANDFPNSNDLSTSDVLDTTSLTFPVPSGEVFGDLELRLNPGWYALVFGSGLFGTSGHGTALWNNPVIGDPSIIVGRDRSWFDLAIFRTPPLEDFRFVLTGTVVPEPGSLSLLLLISMFVLGHSKLAV
jgi:hypothetical protein